MDNGATICCARDISARKAVEQELKRTLAFVQGVIDAFPDFLFEGSAEGRYLNAWTKNPELLAASREHMLGRTLDEVLSPDSAAIAKAAFREADEAGLSFDKVIAIDTEVGRRHFELSVSKMPIGEGEAPHFITVSRDVTARLDLQAALEQQERQFRTLVENSPDLVARFANTQRCLYANPALAARTPCITRELVGSNPADLFGAGAGQELQERLQSVQRSGATLDFELNWNDAQGRAVCCLVSLTPEFDARREMTSILLVGRDVHGGHQGRREGCGAGLRRRPAVALAPGGRPHPAGPGAHQLVQQRRQVHRARRDRRRCRSAGARRDVGTAALRGARYRHRHERRSAASAVPGLLAGRRVDQPPLRWHRLRPGDMPSAGGPDGRADRRRKRARQGQLLSLQRPPGRAGGKHAAWCERRPAGDAHPRR